MENMYQHDLEKVDFKYKLSGTGWAEGHIIIGLQKLTFEVSYLCDPLTEFLEGLIAISTDYAAHVSNNKKIKETLSSDYYFDWLGEPECYSWHLHYESSDRLKIKIASFDYDDEKCKKKNVFSATCNYWDFLGAVSYELSILIKKHGIIGYYATWACKASFPLPQLINLIHFIKTGRTFKTRSMKFTYPNKKFNWVYTTYIKNELSILKIKI